MFTANPFQPCPWGDGDAPALSLYSHHRVRLLPTPQRREAAFSSGALRSWVCEGPRPPPLFHSHPWPPGGKTGIQHANLLREPAFQGSCCLARGSLSCHLLWGRLMKPLCEQTPAWGGDPRSPAQLQVGAAAGLPGGVFVPAYVTVSYFHWQDQADCPG